MPIDLGTVQLDDVVVLRQLRRDLKDDWFPDPRGFEDIFSTKQLQKVISDNFAKNEGVYRPSKRTLLNIPKANFTLRYALETGIADRAVYHGLTASLVPFFDPLLPWNVFNHRAAASKDLERYLFRRSIPAWRDFVGVVENVTKGTAVLLSTDLSNYFEHINLEKLKRVIEALLPEVKADAGEKARLRSNITALFEFLSQWSYNETQGLPQNRDASSFLANLYMLPVDRIMIEQGYQYFRYMDDIKIVCDTEFAARKALKQLSLALREYGLSVNSGKTVICNASDIDQVAKCLDLGGDELHQIDAIWGTRSPRSIARSFPLLRDTALQLLRRGEVNHRMFRFCMSRLVVLAQCPEFQVPPQFFSSITPLIIEALSTAPFATDQLVQYLRAVPLTEGDFRTISEMLCDPNRNFYTWQTYRIWTLLVQKGHFDQGLMEYANGLNRAGVDDANRAGAVLYMGALGGENDRISVAENFARSTSFLGQRTALVAVQELEFRPHIEAHVVPAVRSDLVGVFKGLSRKGIYVSPPEAVPITRYIDMGNHYD